MKFKIELPKQPKAPIAIGTPVNPIRAVNTIELNGVIPTIGIITPKSAPMKYGFAPIADRIEFPMICSIPITNGWMISATK
ncbi:hypothetical protein MEPL1_13c00020 [Melissococcus plutonius]|nr:hypothetical protein MEPL1_13c00020 [Melissococcus plutonius]